MRTLFLDLVSHDGLLACVTPEGVAASAAVAGRIGDHEVPPLLERVVREAGWAMEDIARVACVTGPGGFTSQRVAVALANALAWGLRIPAGSAHLRALWAARSSPSAAWAHSTKKDLLFFALPGQDIRTCAPAEAAASVPPGTALTGELLPEHRAAFGQAGVPAASAASTGDVLPAFVDTLSYGRDPLQPWYGRGY